MRCMSLYILLEDYHMIIKTVIIKWNINPCCAEFISRNYHLPCLFNTDMVQVVEIILPGRTCLTCIQYHGSWWPVSFIVMTQLVCKISVPVPERLS